MARPQQGIHSTRRQAPVIPASRLNEHHLLDDNVTVTSTDTSATPDDISSAINPAQDPHVNIIKNDTESDGNVFVFAAFADKRDETIYSDLTGAFPFMSLQGNVCFLIVYHYETNAILAVPIPNFTDKISHNKGVSEYDSGAKQSQGECGGKGITNI
jgi:hypothetical protein